MTLFLQERSIHRTVLENGIVVIAVENPAADIVAGRIFVRAGSLHEPRKHAGVFNLMASLLTKGTNQLSSLEIAEQVESVGASLGADASADYSLLSFKTVSADFVDILELAAQLLRFPSFPESEVELERRLMLQNIRSMQEQPFALAYDQLRRAMYGEHPYALSGLGTEETVAALDRETLVHYHQTYFRPDNLVISIVGRMVPEEAIALIEKVFHDWQPPQISLPQLSLPAVEPQGAQRVQVQETQQSVVMLGYLAPSVKSPDYATLKLLNTYLGNGLSSRLFTELREKQGLAYEVSAFYPTRLDTSQFAAYMGTAPQNTAIALEGLQHELDRLRTTPLTAEEMQAAKNKMLGQYALGKQTNSQIAQVLGWYETLGLGLEFDQHFQDAVAVVTLDMAQAAAQRYFQAPYISLLGPAAAVSPWQNQNPGQ